MGMPITVKVRDAMDKTVILIEGNKSCMEALKEMIKNNVWSVVVTKEGLPVGVLTERDILRRVVAKNLNIEKVKVEEVMSSPIITIAPDEPIGKAMEMMAVKEIRRLYVVEEGKIIGRLTQTGVFRFLLNVMLTLSEFL